MSGIVIDARLKLPPNLMRDLNKIDMIADSIKLTFQDINDELRFMGANVANVRRQMQGMKFGSGGTTSNARAPKPKAPPFAFTHDPQAGMRFYAAAAAAGDPLAGRMFNKYKNQYSQQTRNQANAQMYQKGGGNALLTDIMARTRFGAGGKGMPLGVDLQRLIGSGMGHLIPNLLGGAASATGANVGLDGLLAGFEALGPVVWALTAAATALSISFAGASASANYYAAIGKSQALGGGTSNQAYQSALINRITGSDFAGASQNLNPIAAAAAGVSPFTGPFGDIDYNKRGLRLFDAIRRQPTLEAARRLAAQAGNPTLANAYLLDPETAKMVRNQQGGADQTLGGVGASFNAQKDLLGAEAERTAALVWTPFMKAMTVSLMDVNHALDFVTNLLDSVETFFHLKDPSEKMDKAADKMNRAADKYISLNNGTFGGGARARAAASQGNPGYKGLGYGQDQMGVL